MGVVVRLLLVLTVGCSAARVAGAGARAATRQWDAYCCLGGDATSPVGCRAHAGAAEACVEGGALAIECRPAIGCATGNDGCFCCREVGSSACYRSHRSARAPPPEKPPPPKGYEVQHRRPGRVWSNY